MFHVEQKYEKMKIKANIVDLENQSIYPASVEIRSGSITNIEKLDERLDNYIIPGFIDAHIHIESSMLSPVEFSKQAMRHGTLAVISDPHEIANVCGIEGVEYMIENSTNTPMKIFFGAPSCVPATPFETSGNVLDSTAVEKLMSKKDILYLSEVMNFPAVVAGEEEVMRKIESARKRNKVIDGHAPGLKGDALKKYVEAGISTDHECFTIDEAREKIALGMKVLIREGSAAKNFNSLYKLIDEFPDMVMLCSDDKHPEDLMESHINKVAARAVKLGCNIFNVIKASSVNAIKHYKLDVGSLHINDKADFIIVDNLNEFNLLELYIDGNQIYDKNTGLDVEYFKIHTKIINNFNANRIAKEDIFVDSYGKKYVNCIEVLEGELITRTKRIEVIESIEKTASANNLSKIIVINRYADSKPAVGYITGFGIKNAAIASTIAHDCHNLIVIGDGDEYLVKAANALIDMRGGISFANEEKLKVLSLEIGGIMTNKPVDVVAAEYKSIESFIKMNGCTLNAPFMTMAFMALLVIPELKISDKGLFDITSKDLFVPLFQD